MGAVTGDAGPSAQTRFALLGEALWLLAQSPLHGAFALEQATQLVIPPLGLGQFRLWRRGTKPVGLATWAAVSAAVEARLLGGAHVIAPGEWASGERIVAMDFVAPFGDVRAMVADLRRNVLRGRDITATRRDAAGLLRRVARYPAVDAAGRRIGCDPRHRAP